MKAVILAAGRGERLQPITTTRPKPMIPLAGKPLLEHNIESLKRAGIKEILLIVGYKEEMIKTYFLDGVDKFNIKINYLSQKEHLGTAHATNLAKEFVSDDEFLLLYGDLLIDPQIFSKIINLFNGRTSNGLITLLRVNNPQDYGIITLNSDGYVLKVTEKPNPSLNLGNLANAGLYIFDSAIFKAIKLTNLSLRKEYELTDSIQIMINKFGCKIVGYDLQDLYWNDIGLPWQLLDANQFLLKVIPNVVEGKVEENVKIIGNVYISKDAIIKSGSYIKGPCYIGTRSIIGPNAYIRPFTSIGDDCRVGISEVKNSIIFSNTAIPHFNYVGDSIICERVNLGAGTKISNLRFDNKTIKVTIKNQLIDSGKRKFGSVIGPNSQTGINTSIMCGKKIGQNCIVGAHTLVNEDVEPDTLYYQDPKKGIQKKKLLNFSPS